jgi:hypothetical protein
MTHAADGNSEQAQTEELPDRYAALLSRARTIEAQTLIRSVFGSFTHWQRESGARVRKVRATYYLAMERFVGDTRTRQRQEQWPHLSPYRSDHLR